MKCRRVCIVVPGYSADHDDWCIPVLRTFVDALAERTEVVVITPHYPFTRSVYSVGRALVHCLSDRKLRGFDRIRLWRRTLQRIVSLGRENRFDAIHAFWGTETGWLATIAARRLRIPSIVSLAGGELAALPTHGYGSQLRASGRFFVRRSLARADVITAGSSWMIALLPEPYRSRARRIPLGVDTSLFTPGPPRTGQRLLVVSSLYPWKDVSTVLNAVADVVTDMPDVRLDVVGTGVLSGSLAAEATRLGIDEAVRFHGDVRFERMPEVYKRADRLVHAGWYESQGMVVLEALATGLPVIATDVGIAAQLSGAHLRTFSPGDAHGLAAAIRGSLSDAQSAVATSRYGTNLADTEYSMSVCVDSFLELYERAGD